MARIIAIAGKPSIYVHSRDLGTSGRASEPSIEYDAVDVTSFADAAHRNLLGQQTVSYRYDGLFDDAANASHTLLNDLLGTKRVVSIYSGGDGTSSEGVGFSNAYVTNYRPVGSVGGALALGADITQDGTWDRIVSLRTKADFTANGTGPDIDGGTVGTNGGVFYVHIFSGSGSGAGSGTMWSFTLEDSAGGAGTGYATVSGATGTIGSGTTLGTAIAFSGTLRRYRRVIFTLNAASGSITAQAGVGTR